MDNMQPSKTRRKRDLNYLNHPVFLQLQKIYGKGVSHAELKIIAQNLSNFYRIELSRDEKRMKNLLINWYALNWSTIVESLDKFLIKIL